MNKTAEAEVVKAAYAAMAKKYHPDKGGTSQRMKEINEAFEVLSDAARKARYDTVYQQGKKKSEPREDNRTQSNSYQRQRQSTSGPTSSHNYNTYEGQRYSEQRQQTSTSPPARDKLLPWPSWRWQRVALISCLPIALFLIFIVHSTVFTVLGWMLLTIASYACIKTGCLNKVKGASMYTKLAARFAIVTGLCSMGLIAVFVGIPLAVIGILVIALLPEGKS